MRLFAALGVAAAFLVSAGPALAWGDLGHKVTALIAYRHLTPKARTALDALLAADDDPLTAPDFASRATWADKYRNGHRETAAWHFVDIEIDHPDLMCATSWPAAEAEAQARSALPCSGAQDRSDPYHLESAISPHRKGVGNYRGVGLMPPA